MEHFTTVFEVLTGSTQVDILIFRLQESVEKYHRSSVVKHFVEKSFGIDFTKILLIGSENVEILRKFTTPTIS